MFLSRLIMYITKVSFLIIMCTNCVFDADKRAQTSEQARTNTQTGARNQHNRVGTNERQDEREQVRTCRQTNANEHERAQTRARTSTDEHKRMHKQAGTTERVQTNSRTSTNKQVVGTSSILVCILHSTRSCPRTNFLPLHSYYTDGHAIFLLNLLLTFLQPKFDPSSQEDLVADETEEGETGELGQVGQKHRGGSGGNSGSSCRS